jgi:hypothetical protein
MRLAPLFAALAAAASELRGARAGGAAQQETSRGTIAFGSWN